MAISTIRVRIRKDPHHPGTWTIEADNQRDNNERFGEVAIDFFGKRILRNQRKMPDHNPIVFNQGDTLIFFCTPPHAFEINAKKDSTVDPISGTPDDPFGWTGPQNAEPGDHITAVVTTGAGVNNQAFYKFFGKVFENGSPQDFDPDGYCGS
jgi:hypothetical protein